MDVEVAYALPDRQAVVPLQVPLGTTVIEAVLLSGITGQFPGLDPQQCDIGIFGSVVDPNQLVQSGQRIEIYRQLLADPKEVRRRLAAEGKTMGQSGKVDT
ncbi:MAG: RnfH family protein [Gammaproteobacteria bacterium]|nr:RnfH family protein [Gammaproteobacteria bacterium]